VLYIYAHHVIVLRLFRMTGVKLNAEEAERAYPLRLLHKLTERGHEKLLRCADLYGTCA
jgi:hypothetical protein